MPILLLGAGSQGVSPVPPVTANLTVYVRGNTGLWQDTAATTPATANGDLIARWDDLSGNGNNLLQATSANRPKVLNATLNGTTVVDFSAGSRYLNTASGAWGGLCTSYYVLRTPASFAAFPPLFGDGNDCLDYYINNAGKPNIDARSVVGIATATNAMSVSTWYQQVLGWNNSTKTYRFRTGKAANGNGTSANGVGTTTISHIGFNGVSAYYTDYIAMILIYAAEHDAATMQSVEGWISSYYGNAV